MFIFSTLKKLSISVFLIVRKNIKYKLFIVYLLVISIPIIIFGIISDQMFFSAIESDFISSREIINDQILNNIETNIEDLKRQSMASYLADEDIINYINISLNQINIDYIKTYDSLHSFLQSIMQTNQTLSRISLVSKDGSVKCFVSRHINRKNSIIIKDSYVNSSLLDETLLLKGMPFVSVFHDYPKNSVQSGDIATITVSRAIIDMKTYKIVGAIILELDVQNISNVFTNTGTEVGDSETLLDKDGGVIYSNSGLNSQTLKKLPSTFISNGRLNTKVFVNGSEMFILISPPTENGWRIISLTPVNQLKNKSQFINKINITLLLILLVFTFFISILVSNIITKPLKKLMRSFKAFQEGNFSVSIPVKGLDELAQISGTFNQMVFNIKKLIEQKYEIGLLKKQAELEALQSQINPHFLFNTLNSIKSVTARSDCEKATEMIQNLSELFRYTLNHGVNIVPFSKELENIRNYLRMQEYRYSGKYKVQYNIDDEVLEYPIARLTLQPIIENALYHGLEPKSGKGELIIAARSDGDKYYIYISNNGINIPEDELNKINKLLEYSSEGEQNPFPEKLGVFNINSRIKLYFGNEYGLKIFSTPGTNTTVKIILPTQKAKDAT